METDSSLLNSHHFEILHRRGITLQLFEMDLKDISPPVLAGDSLTLTPNDVAKIMSSFRRFHQETAVRPATNLPEQPADGWVRFASNPHLFRIMTQAVPTTTIVVPQEKILQNAFDRFRQRLQEENVMNNIVEPSTQSTAFLRKRLLLEHLFPSEVHRSLGCLLRYLDTPLKESEMNECTTNTSDTSSHNSDSPPNVNALALSDRMFMILSSIYVTSGRHCSRIQEAFDAFDAEYRRYRSLPMKNSKDGTDAWRRNSK